jgi:hypothetical protein
LSKVQKKVSGIKYSKDKIQERTRIKKRLYRVKKEKENKKRRTDIPCFHKACPRENGEQARLSTKTFDLSNPRSNSVIPMQMGIYTLSVIPMKPGLDLIGKTEKPP